MHHPHLDRQQCVMMHQKPVIAQATQSQHTIEFPATVVVVAHRHLRLGVIRSLLAMPCAMLRCVRVVRVSRCDDSAAGWPEVAEC